jgi:hypothetical protein
MTAYLGLVLLVVGTVVVMPVLLVAVAVDIGAEVVAIVAIPRPALPGGGWCYAPPPEDGQGSVSNGPSRHVPDAAGSLAHEAAV